MSDFLRLLLLILLGSFLKDPVPGDTDTDTDVPVDTFDTDDTDVPIGPGPCDQQGWGHLDHYDEATSIHVRVNGDDAGTGTSSDPLATVNEAVVRAGQGTGPQFIILGPGDFITNIVIDLPNGFAPQKLVHIEGCGPDETILVPGDLTKPTTVVDGGKVKMGGVAVDGGNRGIVAANGARVRLDTVHVKNADRIGVLVQGSETRMWTVDTEVHDPEPVGGMMGWGIGVNQGFLSMKGGGVYDAHEFGVHAHFAHVDLKDIEVHRTVPDLGGRFGRGLQLQSSWGEVRDADLSDNHDAGLLGIAPDGIIIGNIVIDITGAGVTGGDGMVFTGRGGVSNVKLAGNSVLNSARAAVLLENIDAELDGNLPSLSGLEINGLQMFSQGFTTVSGTDASLVEPLTVPLDIDRTVIQPDVY